jgi:solute carrier family 25 protein 42
VVAPAERIKMSFQVSDEKFTYKSALQRGREYIKSGGFFSLWKGHSTTILRVAPYAGLTYAFHDIAENIFKRVVGEPLPYSYKFLAGSIGGMGGTLITYPLDVLRIRLALRPDTTFLIEMRQGGLYNGLLPTIIGIIPYAGTTWLVKHTLQDMYMDRFGSKIYGLSLLLVNACAGLSGQFVTYPLDIIRRRMQMAIYDKSLENQVTIR